MIAAADIAAKLAGRPDALDVFTARAEARAYLYSEGELDLHEAVDVLQADAVRTGLVAAIGQDRVQAIMAKAFRAVCRPQIVETLIKDDPVVLPMWRAATTGKVGRPSKEQENSDNVTIKSGRGNARAYTLDRLKRERRAAKTAVDALFYSLRQRGAAALAEQACRNRLAELSSAQVRNVIARLMRLRSRTSRYPAITDDLLFQLGEQLA